MKRYYYIVTFYDNTKPIMVVTSLVLPTKMIKARVDALGFVFENIKDVAETNLAKDIIYYSRKKKAFNIDNVFVEF